KEGHYEREHVDAKGCCEGPGVNLPLEYAPDLARMAIERQSQQAETDGHQDKVHDQAAAPALVRIRLRHPGRLLECLKHALRRRDAGAPGVDLARGSKRTGQA